MVPRREDVRVCRHRVVRSDEIPGPEMMPPHDQQFFFRAGYLTEMEARLVYGRKANRMIAYMQKSRDLYTNLDPDEVERLKTHLCLIMADFGAKI